MTKCEECGQEREVKDIEGNLLCDECSEEIVRCYFCNKLLATSYDNLGDNFGKLSVPELSLPDKQTNMIFCNIDCLEGYLQRYKKELKERDKGCNC
jgi:predicted RNA-binding Zn-ribbon protein involved in translation (DUF1610 family)